MSPKILQQISEYYISVALCWYMPDIRHVLIIKPGVAIMGVACTSV